LALRDADAAKRLFRNGVSDLSRPQPGVINTDLAPIYGLAIADIKKEGTLRSRCRHRPVQYLNNIVEQDHRAIKRRVNAKQRFREFQAARRTIQDEAMHAGVAKPDTILAWYRRLVAEKFDGSQHRQYPGRPTVQPDVEALVVRMARENTGWGYDRIVGALTNLGHRLSDQTVGNILRGHGITPAPKRRRTTSWKDFISAQVHAFCRATVQAIRGLYVTCASHRSTTAHCAQA
jgi:DDE domain/Homeodomain-like domain